MNSDNNDTPRNPGGRPALPADEKRIQRALRLNAAEWARLQKRAKAAGLSAAAFVRRECC